MGAVIAYSAEPISSVRAVVLATFLGLLLIVVAFGALRTLARTAPTRVPEPLHPAKRRQPHDLSTDAGSRDHAALARSLGYRVNPTYREVPLRVLVALANRVPDWLTAGTRAPAHLPVSPDPRRKES